MGQDNSNGGERVELKMDFGNLAVEAGEFGKFLRYERQLSDLTVYSYMKTLMKLKRFLENDVLYTGTLSDLTREQIGEFLASMRESYLSRTTISGHVVALRSFYSWAAYKYEKKNLFMLNFFLRNIVKIRTEKNIPFVPTREDIEQLRKTLMRYKELASYDKSTAAYKRAVLAYAIVELIITSGMRSNELRTLRKKDINLEERTAFIKHGKGGYQRISLFGDTACEALKEYFEMKPFAPDDIIFPIKQGNVLHYLIKRWAKRAQINPKIHIHSLRHFFITESQIQNVNSSTVGAQVGQHDPKITQHYTHFTIDFIKQQYDGKRI